MEDPEVNSAISAARFHRPLSGDGLKFYLGEPKPEFCPAHTGKRLDGAGD